MPLLQAEPALHPEHLLDLDSDARGSWWVLQTLSRREKQLCRLLLQRGVSFYCPTIEHRYRSPNGRQRVSHLPLFPNYVFLCGDEEARYAAVCTGCVSQSLFVTDAVGFLKDLRQVQRLIAAGVPMALCDQLQPGDVVRVKDGPMRGLEGRILKRHNGQRLLVSVDFIQCGATVELGDWQVESV